MSYTLNGTVTAADGTKQTITGPVTLTPITPTPTPPTPTPTPPALVASKDGSRATSPATVLVTNDLVSWRLSGAAGAYVIQFQAKGATTWTTAVGTAQVTALVKQVDIYQTSPNGSKFGAPGWWHGVLSGAAVTWTDVPGDPTVVTPTPTPPTPTPTPPPSGNIITINRAAKTGAVLASTLFGSSAASDVDFTPWLDPNIQNAAAQTAGFNDPGMYLRNNTNETANNGDGSPNFTFVDRVLASLPKIMPSGGLFTYSLGGGPNTPSLQASSAVAIHKRFKAGLPANIKLGYEFLNEPDGRVSIGDYCSGFNAVADALHAIDPTILVGGLIYSWLQAGDYKTFAAQCGARIGFMPYHSYTFDSNAQGVALFQQALARGQKDGADLRAAVAGTAAANAPASLGEYNVAANTTTDPRQQTLDGVLYNFCLIYGTFTADPLTRYGAIWDWMGDGTYGLVIDPSNNPGNKPPYSVIPIGYALKIARKFMAGNVVQSSVSSAFQHLLCLATDKATLFINYGTSDCTFQAQGVSDTTLSVVSNANQTGTPKTVSSSNITVPATSIAVLSP